MQSPSKTYFLWTEGIPEKYSKIKDLDINNHYKYRHVLELPRKHILCGLKEYQKKVLKPKIQILTTTISIHMACDTKKDIFYTYLRNIEKKF